MRFTCRNHPFPVEAFFRRSLVLAFAVPVEQLQPLIPECVTPDTFQDRLGFVAVAMVETRNLRPQGWPVIFGSDFFLIGYRIFVRYTTNDGRRLRGLYILRSETDKKRMEVLGSRFTRYRYVTTDVRCETDATRIRVTAPSTGFLVEVDVSETEPSLPGESPFADWGEARRFSGPLPFTFSYDPRTRQVVSLQGLREAWNPRPVAVHQWRIPFLDSLQLAPLTLANAFLVENVPYRWDRGKVETWNG